MLCGESAKMGTHNVSSNIDIDDINTIMDDVYHTESVTLSEDIIYPNGLSGNFFDVYLNRPMTRISMPSNLRNGEIYRFQIRQDHIGGRAVQWGTQQVNESLNCSFSIDTGSACELHINSGSFYWLALNQSTGRQSHIDISGFTQNALNLKGLKITSFDEATGVICFNHPFVGSVSAEAEVANCTINVNNNFYFIDEQSDTWIGQFPFGVTQFTYYSVSEGASGILVKEGVYSNSSHLKAKVRMAEHLTDDFVSGSDDGLLNWREANSIGNTTTTSSADVDENHVGMLMQRLTSGLTANARTSSTLGSDAYVLSNMRVGIEGICKFNENSLETSDVNYYFGWTDNTQWSLTSDGLYFKIVADGSADGLGRVYCVSAIGGVDTVYDTGIDLPEEEWFQMHIGIPANGDIHFVLNDVTVHEVARSTVGLSVKLTCGFGQYYDYTGTPLPDHKDWFIDTFSLKYRMNLDRI